MSRFVFLLNGEPLLALHTWNQVMDTRMGEGQRVLYETLKTTPPEKFLHGLDKPAQDYVVLPGN